MKAFNKAEIVWISVIFLILFAISYPNFIVSLRRARDVTRKSDIGAIANGLNEFFEDFGTYPLSSEDGRIIGCLKEGTTPGVDKKERLTVDLSPCKWGEEPLIDLTPGSTKIYLSVVPVDPNNSKEVKYRYFSNGRKFQIFTALEGSDEPEFDPKVLARSIDCGVWKCNMGRASADGPVNISIEQWETQIEEARKKQESGIRN